MPEFTRPITSVESVLQDDYRQRCGFMIVDALRHTFSLLVQTQQGYNTSLLAEEGDLPPDLEPVFIVPADELDDTIFQQILDNPLLPQYLVAQDEN